MREDLLGITVIKIKNLSKENYPDKKFRSLVRQELELFRDKLQEKEKFKIKELESKAEQFRLVKNLLK